MVTLRGIAAAVGLLALGLGVGAQEAEFGIPSEYTDWDNANWVLTSRQYIPGQYQSQLNMANGYFGCALASAGPFFETVKNLTVPEGGLPNINGWPLDNPRKTFCTIAFFWDSQRNTTRTNFPWLLQNGWESVISGVPHWGGIVLDVEGAHLDGDVVNTTVADFRSSLSAKHGLATWSYRWSPEGVDDLTMDVNYTAFAHRSRPNVAVVRADFTASRDVRVTVTDLLDGRSADRTTFEAKAMNDDGRSIETGVHPLGLANITGKVVSTVAFEGEGVNAGSRRMADADWVPSANESTIGQTFDVDMRAGQTVTVYKYVGVASSDAFSDPHAIARNASHCAHEAGYDRLLDEHRAEWEKILPAELVDDYADAQGRLADDVNILDLQVSSVMTPYYLLQNTLPSPPKPGLAEQSISVGGLTSESYAGMIFWDADLFMAPGLALSHPQYARQINNYRILLAPQARRNAVLNGYSDGAILYPWTSGRFGNCTATGPCVDYQYHLNSDIALSLLEQRNVTGDEEWWREEAWPILDSVAVMYSELLQYNESTGKYGIKNHTDPDEYANGIDNGAFTLASASKLLTLGNYFRQLYGQPVNETWNEMALNIAIPYDDSGITIEYEGMNNSVPIKQADVVLNTYPLNYRNNYTEQQSLSDLDYYAGKQSPDGPAMTFGILSIIANQVSPSGCSAYTYALNSFEPYTRAPWYQFSEQQIDNFTENGGTNPAWPFLTGHGGFNQVGPFGWLGLRTDAPTLYIDPALPPQVPQVRLRTFYYAGATFKASMNYTHTTITRVETTNEYINASYAPNPMPVQVGDEPRETHEISVGETIYVNNRLYTSNLTVPNNLLQCLPASSPDEHRQGQYPLAAIDGAISTLWQPLTPERASMIVDMETVEPQPVIGLAFNWGVTPPVTGDVYLSNSSTFDGEAVVIPLGNIEISEPYNTDPDIRPFTGNTTNIAIVSSEGGAIFSGRYLKLEIEGTQGPLTEFGGSVAEVSLIGAEGRDQIRDWTQVTASTGSGSGSSSSGNTTDEYTASDSDSTTTLTTTTTTSDYASTSTTTSSAPSASSSSSGGAYA